MLYDALIAPFAEFEFMRRALIGSLALSLGAAPIGVFLMLRRMSLIGDAMAHAILPGAAIGFLVAGLSLVAMAAGGLIAGFIIAVGAGLIARSTELRDDASLAGEQVSRQRLALAETVHGLPRAAAGVQHTVGVVEDHDRLAALLDEHPAANRRVMRKLLNVFGGKGGSRAWRTR